MMYAHQPEKTRRGRIQTPPDSLALAITRRGAQEGMPRRAEIDQRAATVLEHRGDGGETTRPVAF
jgi:hypothetical protein